MRRHTPGLWRVELEGDGRATKILDDVVWFTWKLSDRGIYSFEAASGQAGIYFRESAAVDTATGEPVLGEPVLMVSLPTLKLDFSVSNDHRWLAYAQALPPDGDIILIEG